MSCFSCEGIFSTNSELLRHIRLVHSSSASFRCNDNFCHRSFSSLNSFCKHRLKNHSPEPSTLLPSVAIKSPATTYQPVRSLDLETDLISERLASKNLSLDGNWSDDGDDVDDDACNSNIFQSNSNISSTTTAGDTLSQLSNHLTQQAGHFVSKLYNLSDLPRKRVPFIVEEVTSLANGSAANIVRDAVLDRLKSLDESAENLSKTTALFDRLQRPFQNFETEYSCFKQFASSGTLILPEQILLGQRNEYKEENGVRKLIHVPVTAEFIRIRLVFKKFFEITNVYHDTMTYIQSLYNNSGIISNFVQGSFWQKKIPSFENKTVLPLFLYFDDYENNNPLGSHAGIGKCGAVYLSIPCLPVKYQSKLENIFLFILFNTIDRKVFKNEIIFSSVIDELKFLRTHGITVSTPSGDVQIYFELALILGDNLGMHGMLGLVECFRANFPCRFCLVQRDKINSIFDENFCQLRDVANYDYGLELNDVSRTGISEKCVFHELNDFHLTRNLSVDSMHDLAEGICPRDVAKVLHYFICTVKLFSLEELNSRIRGFHYSLHDKSNKPPDITLARIKHGFLSMSSSEMFTFVRNLPLIIGDLVPEGTMPHWQVIIHLKTLIEIIMNKAHVPGTDDLLRTLITEYLVEISELFPNSLTPKHHFLIHYPRLMAQMGPLCKLASMRYESKHREAKITSRVSNSRVNVCRTIAVKHQLKLNYRFMNYAPYADYSHGPARKVILTELPNFAEFSVALPSNISQVVNVTKWIEFSGQRLKRNSVLVIGTGSGPKFFIVRTILLEKTHRIVLVAKTIKRCLFNVHYQAYEVLHEDEEEWRCSVWSRFRYAMRISHKVTLNNGSTFVIKNW